jgi:hypothetical protein
LQEVIRGFELIFFAIPCRDGLLKTRPAELPESFAGGGECGVSRYERPYARGRRRQKKDSEQTNCHGCMAHRPAVLGIVKSD